MKRYMNIVDRLRGRAIVQCDICGYIDPWEFAENAPRWTEGPDHEHNGWSHGANPDAHFCQHCTEILYEKLRPQSFYRMCGEND